MTTTFPSLEQAGPNDRASSLLRRRLQPETQHMHQTLSVERLSREHWDRLTPGFRDLSYRQCGTYAEAAAKDVGARLELVAISEGSTIVALAAVRVKMLPLLPVGVAYVNHGPVTMRTDTFVPETFVASVAALRAEYVDRRGLQLRIAAPQGGGDYNAAQTACLLDQGLKLSNVPHSLETFILDLDRPLAAIRSGLDSKWSASLRRAERSNLVITRTQDPADFERFEALYDGIVERKGFVARQGARFFSDVSRRAPSSDGMIIHLAWHENEPVAGHVGSFVGDTGLSILAATGPRGRELCAAFAVWWAAIEHASENGNRYYDLGGVDQCDNPDVYRFKKRVGGRHVTSAGNFEIAPSRSQKMLIDTAEQAWTHLRSAKGRFARWRPGSVPAT